MLSKAYRNRTFLIIRFDDFSDYENLAIRLLQSLYTSNPDMARLAIKRENYEFNKFSALEIASKFVEYDLSSNTDL